MITKILIAAIFGPPILAGIVLLVFGCWWLQMQQEIEEKEARHAKG
ncbi:MAG: hypothetical protein ACI4MM_05105 [Candidatus Ventricola sp.]